MLIITGLSTKIHPPLYLIYTPLKILTTLRLKYKWISVGIVNHIFLVAY